MLRGFVIGLGVLMVAGGAIGVAAGAGFAMAPAFVMGALFLLGTIFERKRYKMPEDHTPGPGWELTGERFEDIGKDRNVEVWFNKASGERRYVRSRG